MGKIIIFSAPSGSGKTTIIRHLLEKFPQLEFSISATCRLPRGTEVTGVDYHFLTLQEFRKKIENNEFVEWEEVYTDTYYGTLKSEMSRIWDKGNVILFDVDVKGGINLKKKFPEALSVFVMPPSVEHLKRRLEARGTDSPEKIAQRVQKAEEEIAYAGQFDVIITNDKLEDALIKAGQITSDYIQQ